MCSLDRLIKEELGFLLRSVRLVSKRKAKKANRKNLTFAGLGAVVFPEDFVLGDVGIEVLQGVFRDVFSHNNLVVSKDVGKGQRRQPALVVGLHRVEPHFSWGDREPDGQISSGILCGHASRPHCLHIAGHDAVPAVRQDTSPREQGHHPGWEEVKSRSL